MKKIIQLFLQGLLVIIPIAATAGILYWLLVSAERLFRIPLQYFIPDGLYIPGLGVVTALLFVFAIGLLVNIYFIKVLLNWLEALLNRLPLVKNLYGGFSNLMRFFSGDQNEDMKQVVAVEISGMKLIGFVTSEKAELGTDSELVSVYFPMSYQLGGYLAYLPRSKCEFLDIPVSDAMQKVLTANI